MFLKVVIALPFPLLGTEVAIRLSTQANRLKFLPSPTEFAFRVAALEELTPIFTACVRSSWKGHLPLAA
jgi:hypothetical protein